MCKERMVKNMYVNICGIKHKIIECEDNFAIDEVHFGMIDFKHAAIKINKDMNEDVKDETICHEMLQAILVHIGREDLSTDEQFVQALGNAIFQSFDIIVENDENDHL